MGTGSSCLPPHSLLQKRKVTLLLVGLDGAGKTSLVQIITGRTPAELPSAGVSEAELTLAGYKVTLLDLPGSAGLRTLWTDAYYRCHGLVFVVDSVDYSRLMENRTVFRDTLTHPSVTGKSVLLLLNKQDHHRAFSMKRLEQSLAVGSIVKRSDCECTVVKCSSKPDCNKLLGKEAIRCGLRALLRQVSPDYQVLCERVQEDTENIRAIDEEMRRGSERHLKIEEETVRKGDMSRGSSLTQAKKSQILEPIQGQMSTPVKTQRSKAFEFEQVSLPGTPIEDKVIVNSCPIIRHTTIDTGDDDLPEESIDESSESISQVLDSLLGSVKSDHHLLASSNPWLDPARLGDLSRNLLDQLDALLTAHTELLQRRRCSETVLIEHHGNHGRLPQQETAVPSESVRRLVLPLLQDPVCSLTPSSCSSQDSSEMFQQAVSLLSTVMVDQVIENLSGSSQSSNTGLGVRESVSSTEGQEVSALCQSSTPGQEQEVSALCQVEKKKFSLFKKLLFSFKKSKKKNDKAAQPDDAQTGPASGAQQPDAQHLVPGSLVPSSLVPGSLVPGSLVPSSLVPSSLVPSSLVPGSLMPSSLVPGSLMPSSLVPSSLVHSILVPSILAALAW
ncbi:uncharacterized protein LOC134038499 [Osmerus eperlanus]|uniref:uncharacterized protein LOC134038499 n=1 Tax=Osmerus eperlanus TaxID=29151 RepID=UPI002E1546C2